MVSGRPLRPNDPSVMSSIEAALTKSRRPGLLDVTWHWRWELGGTALVAGLLTLIVISFRAVGLINGAFGPFVAGADDAAALHTAAA